MKLVMDGVTYHLRVKLGSFTESFRIEDGPNAGTLLSGAESRDIVGTYFEHTLNVEPDPRYYQDYCNFYTAISTPVESHSITLPHNQGTMTYDAMVLSGKHTLQDRMAGVNRYKGLSVNFKAKAPQITPD